MTTGYLDTAESLATRLHGDQKDKAGRPYIEHPRRVAGLVALAGGDWRQQCAAWLHDTIEDTEADGSYLLGAGMPSSVVSIVEVLTRRPSGGAEAYYKGVRNAPGAPLVKFCDIHDNLDPTRLSYLDDSEKARLRKKYALALMWLVNE